jgi:TIR domain/Domain of unknown function (DUF4062)
MITPIRVFIASPGEVSEERDIASHVISEIGRIFGDPFELHVEAIRWETHAVPDVGDDAQDVINEQVGQFDVLVGVMWRRFGSPTKRGDSGTGEEFERAYRLFRKHGRPKIMFYFRTTPFYTADLVSIAQFRRVAEFRKKLEKLGVLYWTYNTPLEFERNVREHLIRQIFGIADKKGPEGRAKETLKYRETRRETVLERPSVFIAYSRFDRVAARSFYSALRATGYDVWLDEQNLVPGQMWVQEVDREIRMRDVMLLLISSKSNLTDGLVAREMAIYTERVAAFTRPVLIPIRLDPVEPPPKLRHLQWVDYFVPDGLQRVLEAIGRVTRSKLR